MTIGDSYPLPLINEILDQLGNAKYFTTLDLFTGFHQVFLMDEDAHKTAFTTPGGHFEFKRLPFGLSNAPRTFQRVMDIVLSGLIGIVCFVYLDDVVIYARDLKEHEEKFQQAMDRLRAANLKLQYEKCEFLKKEVVYLGHVISEHGIRPDEKKLEALKKFPLPKTVKNIQKFLGFANYYRRFVPYFSYIAKTLTLLLKKDNPFVWGKDQQEAFEKIKNELLENAVLHYPDPSKRFKVTTDAFGYGIAAVLSQDVDGTDRPIAFISRTLSEG